jgi:hypothetical protein
MEAGMESGVYELGRFGDGRLEKGGPCFTGLWWQKQAPASGGLRVRGLARFGFTGFCATRV